ncbi:MAG TPA: YfhO family protein [Myxococcales bacterium]|jgi:hypothetical protein
MTPANAAKDQKRANDGASRLRATALAAAPYLACVLLVLTFHFRLALPGRALVANDFRAYFIPVRAGLQQTLHQGEWPFWQRGMFLGYPILGDIQAQLANPLTWLTLPLDAARGITVQSLFELCLAACGMAYWMKQRGLRAVSGVFAGACFALSLKETVHLHHWTFASSTCAWPWMLAGLDGLRRTGRARFAALTACAAAGSWIGGSAQMAWFGCGLATVYGIHVAWSLRGPWLRLLAVAAPAFGVALSAPILWPVLELSALGPRGAGVTYRFASSWNWPDARVWPVMLLPRLWGGRPDYRGPMNYWEVQGYLGLLPMALLAVAPLRRKGAWIFAAIAVLTLPICFGDRSWFQLHWLCWKLLPGYSAFRNPTRALMLTAFCCSVLAAEGLERLRDDARLRLRVLGALGVLAACVGLCAGFVRAPQVKDDAEIAVWLLAACAIWASLARRDARWAMCAIPLFLADVAAQAWDSPEIAPASGENHALDSMANLVPRPPAPRRVAVLEPWGELNNVTYARGWEGVTGYGPTALARVLRLFEATFTGRIPPARPLVDDENFPRFRIHSPLVPLFASPLLVSNLPAGLARTKDVYGLPALPRVFWTSAWQAVPDDATGALLPEAAAGQRVLLPEPFERPSVAAVPTGATSVRVFVNSLEADVDAPADGLAVVLDPYYPGWTATVDGAPAPLLRADVAFEAVPVRAGKHHLRLRYFPARLLPGFAVAILAAALLALLCKLASQRVDTRSPGRYFPPP